MSLVIAGAGGAIAASGIRALTTAPRRARIRDRVASAAGRTVVLAEKARRDARNRAAGLAAHAAGWTRKDDDAPDDKLVARVRSTLGHVASHPHAIEVEAENGRIRLGGPVLRRELDRIIRAVRRVHGVHDVESRLEAHEAADGIPSLQGPGRIGHVPELLQERWTPSLRVGAGALAVLTMAYGTTRLRSVTGITLTALGALLLARASIDKPISRILGIGAERRSVELEKTITIHAPVEEVFAWWASFERFPEIMEHVEAVTMTDDRHSHWKVQGPLGATVEWDAETTSFIPSERIAWKSVEGSLIKNAGVIRFEPVDDGHATRLGVRLSYNPVVGYVGHSIAALFGTDPKKALDDDLLRLKSLIEEGKATAHGHQVTRDEVNVLSVPIDEGRARSER